MANRMLVDAAEPGEVRIAIVRNDQLCEYAHESADNLPLRGNIYLGRITRIEPALQAAFVEYGGNRHGFLSFGEVHPDYYRISEADRQAILDEETAEAAQDGEETPGEDPESAAPDGVATGAVAPVVVPSSAGAAASGQADALAVPVREPDSGGTGVPEPDAPADGVQVVEGDLAVEDIGGDDGDGKGSSGEGGDGAPDPGGERGSRSRLRRHQYRIQDVLQRRQIVLVQVVREERGGKGAALTTHISLAGRYCVFMPNSLRGSGVSRKIQSPADRRKLREFAGTLKLPRGMGVILRTAGLGCSVGDISRDFYSLLDLWESIRTRSMTMASPCLVHEEGDLARRIIRDYYTGDISEIIVEGDDALASIREALGSMAPEGLDRLKPYRGRVPVFVRHNLTAILKQLHSRKVPLKSGGSLIIDPTEALVAIDVNSGRATRETHIEETALRTNLEAVAEIARQMRLRDLAGLIVIDLIDMRDSRNNRAVENCLREALRPDRARLQVGRISPFGLLEMSRQRLRSSLSEATTVPCSACGGAGCVPSMEANASVLLREIRSHLAPARVRELRVSVAPDLLSWLFNNRRRVISRLEERSGVRILMEPDATLAGSDSGVRALKQPYGSGDEMQPPAAAEEAEAPASACTRGQADTASGTGRRRSSAARRKRGDAPAAREGETGEEGRSPPAMPVLPVLPVLPAPVPGLWHSPGQGVTAPGAVPGLSSLVAPSLPVFPAVPPASSGKGGEEGGRVASGGERRGRRPRRGGRAARATDASRQPVADSGGQASAAPNPGESPGREPPDATRPVPPADGAAGPDFPGVSDGAASPAGAAAPAGAGPSAGGGPSAGAGEGEDGGQERDGQSRASRFRRLLETLRPGQP